MSTIMDHACKGQTLVDRIKFWGETDPETPAFIFWGTAGRRVLTRGDVLNLSSRFAYRLKNFGIQPGDYVCIVLPNSPERVIVNFGVILAGAVSMNGNLVRTDGEDLIKSLNTSKCKAIFLESTEKTGLCQKLSDVIDVKDMHADIESEKVPHLKKILFCGQEGNTNEFLASCGKEEKQYIYEDGVSTDICNVLNTSGSTGYSKLVPYSHDTMLTCGYIFSKYLRVNPKTPFFNKAPLGWIAGLPHVYLFSGATRVAIDDRSGQIEDMWEAVCKEKVVSAFISLSVASMLQNQKLKSKNERKLKTVVTGGQPFRSNHLQLMAEITESITIFYGSTEFGVANALTLETEGTGKCDNFKVGKCLAGVEVKIVDSGLNPLPLETVGEILVASPMLTKSYIGSSDASDNFLPNGWFRTGDIGLVNQNGDVFVKGRSSNAIMYGTYIVYPEWLEEKFQTCPGVKEIAIIPVPDPILHHEICACVIPQDPELTEDTFVKFCQSETELDKNSLLNIIPKFVLLLKAFPSTSSGKVDRIKLTQMARSQLKL